MQPFFLLGRKHVLMTGCMRSAGRGRMDQLSKIGVE